MAPYNNFCFLYRKIWREKASLVVTRATWNNDCDDDDDDDEAERPPSFNTLLAHQRRKLRLSFEPMSVIDCCLI